MYKDGFSVRVPQAQESDQYVHLRHGDEYSLRLRNQNGRRCDAVVKIDGETVGTWRIGRNSSIEIERPANSDRKFTFYKLGSSEGDAAQLKNNDGLGLISVTFKPERDQPHEAVRTAKGMPRSFGEATRGGATRGLFSGGTGLGAHSSQSFSEVAALDYDPAQECTIHLRLVAVGEPNIVPLSAARSTPVPPPVAS